LIPAEIAIQLTHVAVGYVIDGEQARLASQGHESAVVLVDDRVGETIGSVTGCGKAGGTPAKLLMATSEAVPLVKVKTTVRVLPSITVRLLA
jgi:hypothetical protein